MTSEFFNDVFNVLKYRYEHKNLDEFEKVEDFYQDIIDEAESDIKKLSCYGLVSLKYDNKLLENYEEDIKECKKIANDENLTYNIINELDDEKFILIIILGFYRKIEKYINNMYNFEDFEDKNYADLILKRLSKIYSKPEKYLFFTIFFCLCNDITFVEEKYFIN